IAVQDGSFRAQTVGTPQLAPPVGVDCELERNSLTPDGGDKGPAGKVPVLDLVAEVDLRGAGGEAGDAGRLAGLRGGRQLFERDKGAGPIDARGGKRGRLAAGRV